MRGPRRRLGLLFGLSPAALSLALLFGPGPAWAQTVPACAKDCQELEASGLLKEGLTPQQCALSVCEEEARTLYKQNRHAEAFASLEYIHAQAERSTAHQLDYGLVLYAMERFEEAIQAFDMVLLHHPSSIRAASQRAHALARLERFDDSLAQFQGMLEFKGADREYRNIRTRSYILGSIGLVKLQQGEVVRGKARLTEALDVDGRNEVANTALRTIVPEMEAGYLNGKGLVHLMAAFEALDLGQAERAQNSLRALMNESPRFAMGYLVLARGLRNQSRYAECEAVLQVAEAKVPTNVDVKFERLRCSILRYGISSPDARPAIAQARDLAAAHPNNETGKRLLGAIDAF